MIPGRSRSDEPRRAFPVPFGARARLYEERAWAESTFRRTDRSNSPSGVRLRAWIIPSRGTRPSAGPRPTVDGLGRLVSPGIVPSEEPRPVRGPPRRRPRLPRLRRPASDRRRPASDRRRPPPAFGSRPRDRSRLRFRRPRRGRTRSGPRPSRGLPPARTGPPRAVRRRSPRRPGSAPCRPIP